MHFSPVKRQHLRGWGEGSGGKEVAYLDVKTPTPLSCGAGVTGNGYGHMDRVGLSYLVI